MGIPKLFLSYARDDSASAQEFEKGLIAAGIEVWRDQKSLYGGEQWPKAIGEAIASSDALLLVWSARAVKSYFVEFEWTTALALKKLIIPCLLDDTPLPSSLSAVNTISCRDIETALPAIIQGVSGPIGQTDPVRKSNVIEKLGEIESSRPKEALQKAKTIFNQEGWVIHSGGGNIIINQKSRLDVIVPLAALGTVILVVIMLSLRENGSSGVNVNQDNGNHEIANRNANAKSSFTGFVKDKKNDEPIEAKLELKITDLPNQTITGASTSDGDFHIDNIPAAIGASGVVLVTAPGYKPHSESIVLPGPKRILLDRER
jgi:TIR domain